MIPHRNRLGLALAALLLCSTGARAGEAELLAEARGLVKAMSSDLKAALKGAIAAGGPASAIGVCALEAPDIATNLSQRSGWAVGRTALRVRNPRNMPSLEERAILVSFLNRARSGEPLANMDMLRVVERDGVKYAHYMKAIPTLGLCTACHGESLAKQVRAAIGERYPADAATGFKVGELRGAFTFVKPLD